MANLENVTKTTEKTDGIVRKVWLLGIGVYVMAFEQIQSQFTKINDGRSRLFNQFVVKDEAYSADTTGKVAKEVREETAVDKRVAEVRKQLGLDTSNAKIKIDELSQKVDELTQALNKLS